MAWLLLIGTGVLALMVLVLAVLTVRLRGRVDVLEHRLAARLPSSDPQWSSDVAPDDHTGSLDDNRPATEYVITRVGEAERGARAGGDRPGPVFADLLLKETVVQTASLFQGLRRALAPETRNRIRFHMRQEVKRSRKQRRTELREVRREWAARQRAAMAADEPAETRAESAA